MCGGRIGGLPSQAVVRLAVGLVVEVPAVGRRDVTLLCPSCSLWGPFGRPDGIWASVVADWGLRGMLANTGAAAGAIVTGAINGPSPLPA